MEPLVVGGLFDSLLSNLLKGLKPDWNKWEKGKAIDGMSLFLDSFKTMVPGSLDDVLIDAAKGAIGDIIKNLGVKQDGVLVVGATTFPEAFGKEVEAVTARGRRSRKEVEDLIRKEGGDPKTFAPWLLLLLQFVPALIDAVQLIRKWLEDNKKPETPKKP